MRLITLLFLLLTASLLTGCVIAEEIWMMKYRAMGGYYDRPAAQKEKP